MSDDPEYRDLQGPLSHASNYVGKIFRGHDSLSLTRRRGNPMLDGADLEALDRVQARIEYLKREGVLPSSYDIHSPVQLLPDRVFDTTNRASVVQAQLNGFDPDGFRTDNPMRKIIFYMDPYVTCSWCNFVSFVDVMTVRRTLAMPKETRELGLPVESLPPCRRCGRADHLQVGSHDFTELIANRERLAREKRERQQAAAAVILRSYRAYLKRMYAQAAAIAKKALEALQAKAATKINNSARRRLCYRRIVAERNLREIGLSNPILLAWALKPYKKNNLKTFWFKRDIELQLVYRDYLELGFRLGFTPTRKQMEDNFAELRRRIEERLTALLALIQRAWRGVMARRIVKLYRKELIRLGQLVRSRVFVIQRAFRGHYARLRITPALKHERVREKTMDEYLKFAEGVARDRNKRVMIEKTKSAYIKDRGEERSARFTSRIEMPSEHNNRKMQAWNKSIYVDDKLSKNVTALMNQQLQENMETKWEIEQNMERKAFLQARIAERGPEGFGKRSEIPDFELKVVNGFLVGPERISRRSKSMKTLLHQEVLDIMEGVVERAAHDFRGFHLLERFKEFNTGRDTGKNEPDYLDKLEKARAKFGATAKVHIDKTKRKPSQRFRREYKFPGWSAVQIHVCVVFVGSLIVSPPQSTDGINEDPLAFLDDDLDATLKLEDEKRRRAQERLADELMLNDRQKQKNAKEKSKQK